MSGKRDAVKRPEIRLSAVDGRQINQSWRKLSRWSTGVAVPSLDTRFVRGNSEPCRRMS
jgi:hypothetical protein